MEVDQGNTRFSDMISADEHQTEDNVTVLPIELTNITGTYIEHLNDDCLLEIFSNNSLTWMDLCSLAETCTRFEQITQRVFPKDFGIDPGYRTYEFQSKNGTKFYANLKDVERILKNFGSNLTKLVIRSKNQDLLTLVGMYCRDVTINHLRVSTISSMEMEGVKTHINSIFQRLRQLTFFSCNFLEVTSQNLNFDSLIELEIIQSCECVVILKQFFPNLERFSWHYSRVYTSESNNALDILYEFIRRHGHLKTINVSGESICRSGLLHVIDSTCMELENLRLNRISRSPLSFDISTQGGLSKLKMLDLEIQFGGESQEIALLQAVKSLEAIRLSSVGGWPLQIFDVLSQLQNLRELHLALTSINRVPWTMLTRLKKVYLEDSHDKFKSADLLNIIRQLTNLEELEYTFVRCNLRKEHFTKIIEIVERRKQVLTLKCCCDFKLEENCNEIRKVKLIKLNDDSEDSDDSSESSESSDSPESSESSESSESQDSDDSEGWETSEDWETSEESDDSEYSDDFDSSFKYW